MSLSLSKEVGERVKLLREERGVSQRAYSRLLGCSQPRVGRYEKGALVPHPEMLMRISDLEGVTIDWLLRGNRAYARMRRKSQRKKPLTEQPTSTPSGAEKTENER